jgi:archaellum component FlaC
VHKGQEIMGEAIQLELNLENKTVEELKLDLMQKQLDQMSDSMGKVRKKLFAEMGEVKKLYAQAQREAEELKILIKMIKNEKTQWTYSEGGYLFNVMESSNQLAITA